MENQFWNMYARLYDRLRFLVPYQELHAEILRRIPTGLEKRSFALDVGCGTGILMQRLHSAYPHWRIVGVDRSPHMVRIAKAKKFDPTHEMVQVCDVANGLPFGSGSMHIVFNTNVLYTLTSPEKALREIHRVLMPGGTFICVNPWKPDQSLIWNEHLRRISLSSPIANAVERARFYTQYGPIMAINAVIAKRAKERVYHFLPATELTELFVRCGFVVDHVCDTAYAGTCCLIVARTPG